MSKYIKGDKVVMEITDRFKNAYGHEYYSVLDSIYSTDFIDEKSEPLSTYTEPLERKNENKQKRIEKLVDRLHNQAAEITRLLAENKRLKAENGNNLWNIEQARAEGEEAAWELARKIAVVLDESGWSSRELIEIFNTASVSEIFDLTHPEAAAKVSQWEKTKEEIKVGDEVKHNTTEYKGIVTRVSERMNKITVMFKDGSSESYNSEMFHKTGRHIDINSLLKQIGEE